MVDSSLAVGSSAVSQSGSRAKLHFGPGSVTDSRLVVDFELATRIDFVIAVIVDFTTPSESHFVWPSPVPLQTL